MKQIEVSEETYEKIKDQLAGEDTIDISSYDDFVGEKFFIRTVTYHLVGEVTKRIGQYLQLKEASFIGDSGRFSDAIKKGTLSEVEPVGIAFVNLNAITDFFPWKHKLPTSQK